MSTSLAKLETSKPMQKIHKILSDGREHDGWELSIMARVTCISTWISHLRRNNFTINCRQEVKKGRRWSFYKGIT